ncbi:hypothetical protein EDC04DRAFT_769661 [Pisolithus marmoratus]|nr:hypothetical protein EDC04DRAFT_769661 [Pisolithus marmoratus]
MDSTDKVSHKRAQLEGCHPGDDGRDVALHNLAVALYNRFQTERKVDDVNEAITVHRAALELRPSGHLQRSLSLHWLALCLLGRYDSQGLVADLEEAVTLGRAALKACPQGHADRGLRLHTLAHYLWKRFKKQAKMYDLDEAIELHRVALELRPSGHPHRCSSLHGLALCFSSRYNNQGVVSDLEEAVTLGRAVLEICPPGHRDRATFLYSLASYLRRRFKKRAMMHSLDEAIELHREALALYPSGHPHRFSSLQEFAICLLDRYDNQGLVADLDEAITLGRAGVELHPPGHPSRAECLRTLSRGIWATFQRPGSGRARSVHQGLLLPHPTSNAGAASTFHDLSLHLWDKFQKQPAIADLDEAICLATYALELRLPKHSDYVVSIEKLAVLVKERSQRIDQGTNSNESVMLGQAADNLCALRDCLRDRFRNQHVIDDLNAAITLHRYVLQLRPAGHASHPSYLHDLALYSVQRFHETASVGDLDEAISLEQNALELSVPGDPIYEASKDSLATCLQMKISAQISQASQESSTPPVVQKTRLPKLSIMSFLKRSKQHQMTTQTCNSSSTLCDSDAQSKYKEI